MGVYMSCVIRYFASVSELQFPAILHGNSLLLLNNTCVRHNNSTLSDVIQLQPGQSGNNTVSGPCASNSSCMIQSIEIGCLHGINENVLNSNFCSMIPIDMSLPVIVGQILLQLSLPTFSSR
jgi:hypothetical protein